MPHDHADDKMTPEPVSFSDYQLAEILRLAMEIKAGAARDRYLERVATTLRGRTVSDIAVRVAANAAYAAEAPRAVVQEEATQPASDACVLGRVAGGRR